MENAKNVYLAGPGVFRQDANEYGCRLQQICSENGINGLYPLDSDPPLFDGMTPEEQGRAIFHANIALIRQSQAVIADLSPFRGPNVDDGTAYEVGFASALGIPVFGYIESPDLRGTYTSEVTSLSPGGTMEDNLGNPIDAKGMLVEQFGMTANLMLAASIREGRVLTSFTEAAQAAASYFSKGA
ncbi:nucleoside 2-deoxyribosyltransferase [Acetobacter malorum DSM 14337]|uniref:Nucleoside 2-deoxyribosyltransferase n=1 Tax=Acetobacter malorum DSM 14337 TaxID=1307910 RepID=A0ABQ0PYU7_9PROT|nr:nucleoside 2-deoxyribosyltransferase [Acetobacter malorum]KXV06726.1 hypothetical protein AD930_06380 [Acetobacter malorum]GBQ85038.1 nucleoside 2-deoxyribosyltransferase [Acetobacter malorum DSM 14337]